MYENRKTKNQKILQSFFAENLGPLIRVPSVENHRSKFFRFLTSKMKKILLMKRHFQAKKEKKSQVQAKKVIAGVKYPCGRIRVISKFRFTSSNIVHTSPPKYCVATCKFSRIKTKLSKNNPTIKKQLAQT